MPKISKQSSTATSKLMPHQSEAVDWIRAEGRGLLADEPGLGKTLSSIEAFSGSEYENVLVVAPAMVIDGGTWREELEKWSNHPEKFTVVPYTSLNARAKTAKGGSTVLDSPKDEYNRRWDAIILDEAHYIKGRKTKWTLALKQLSVISGDVLQLTGTPMPNWAHELFSLIQVLRPRESGRGQRYGSHQRWLDEWFRQSRVYQSKSPHAKKVEGLVACRPVCSTRPTSDPCEHFHEFVQENLGNQFLRRLRDDVLGDLPPLTESNVYVDMDKSATRMYADLKKEYFTLTEDQEEIVAWSEGSLNVMIDKITTSPWLLDMQGEPRGGKLDRLKFDLENRARPTLVAAHYRHSVEAACRVAELAGARAAFVHGGVSRANRTRIIEDFKRGKLDVLVGSLETIAEGITLTQADMAIFLEKSFKPSRNEQMMRRVHRIGQTRPVTILDYITPGTVDATKRSLLSSKTDQQMRVLTAGEMLRLM